MRTTAVVIEAPQRIGLAELTLTAPGPADAVVEVEVSAISTGTERLLWSGDMPAFPGMGYPLVPGYEAVGRVAEDRSGRLAPGTQVFVPGATCYAEARGLFGAAARRVVVPSAKLMPVQGEEAVLLALAATAWHALEGGAAPDLIVGNGVLGRLLARLARLRGADPVVWEIAAERMDGARHPDSDDGRYATIYDVSGDADIAPLLGRLTKGGELVLTGFYAQPITFAYPVAFRAEARLRVAAEWTPADLSAVAALHAEGRLDLSGLITHRQPAAQAADAYGVAFGDPRCLKMTLDWSDQ